MNNWKLNLGLAVLVLLLIAIVSGVFERKANDSKNPALVDTYSAQSITHIELQQNQQRCELTRQVDSINWRLTSPFSAAASSIAVQKILQLPARRDYQTLSADDSKLDQYGLASPQLILRVGNNTIAWGDVNSLDKRRYLKIGNKLLLIAEDLTPFLQDCPKNLLSKALLEPGQQLQGLQLAGLTVSQQKGVWHLTPSPPSDWTQDDINHYLDDWRSAQALMVEPLDKALLRLKPEYRFSLQLQNGDLEFLAFNINGQVWWASPQRQLRYYLFANSAQKLLHPFMPARSGH